MARVESAEQAAASPPTEENHSHCRAMGVKRVDAATSEAEELAQPFSLRPADWNLALLLIIHAQLVRTLEPGHDFANAVDVHQVGAVRAPEQAGVQAAE